ncbi:hypothetical protein SUGI_0854040 [Cryptomeria japonica]|nr:hypothetical protein SUGI_0854040 [Cryptomeria japonica]
MCICRLPASVAAAPPPRVGRRIFFRKFCGRILQKNLWAMDEKFMGPDDSEHLSQALLSIYPPLFSWGTSFLWIDFIFFSILCIFLSVSVAGVPSFGVLSAVGFSHRVL